MSDYTTLGKFVCTNDDYNTLGVFDNEGQISICYANVGEYTEAYLSAEDEEKLRTLLNERKENKDG